MGKIVINSTMGRRAALLALRLGDRLQSAVEEKKETSDCGIRDMMRDFKISITY
jgi:hypothetical protein